MLHKTNTAGFVYDKEAAAVLNTDDGEFQRFMAERARFNDVEKLKSKIEALEARVLELEKRYTLHV